MKVKDFIAMVGNTNEHMIEVMLPPYEKPLGRFTSTVYETKWNIYDDLTPYGDMIIKRYQHINRVAPIYKIASAINGVTESEVKDIHRLYLY